MTIERATRYFILLFVGLCGMLVCHFFIFVLLAYGDASSMRAPYSVLVYPVIYGLFALILSRGKSDHGILDSLSLCSIPTIYWFVLLVKDGKLNVTHISLYDSTGMMLIMPMTVVVVAITMMIVTRRNLKK